MEVANIMTTTNEIDGIPYWIIPGNKDDDGNLVSVSFIYRNKCYEIDLDPEEYVKAPVSSMKLAKLQSLVMRKMRPYLKNH